MLLSIQRFPAFLTTTDPYFLITLSLILFPNSSDNTLVPLPIQFSGFFPFISRFLKLRNNIFDIFAHRFKSKSKIDIIQTNSYKNHNENHLLWYDKLKFNFGNF